MKLLAKSSMESVALFEEKVGIHPSDLSGRDSKGRASQETLDIDTLLLEKLAGRLEGKCSLHGFVVPGSLTMLARSMGYVENGRFTGDLVFHVQAEGDVLYPPDGTVVQGRVEKMNTMGMFVVYEVKDKKNPDADPYAAIKIILPRDLHIGDEIFNACEPGDLVELEIKKSRFQVNDEFILCVGDFRRVLSKVRSSLAAEETAPESVAAVKEDDDEEEEEEEEEAEGKDAE